MAGHGGRGTRTDPFISAVRNSPLPKGIAVAAIDAVGHGDRISGKPSDLELLRDLADPRTYKTMTADWHALLDLLLSEGSFDAKAIGYIGLSGGTLFGLPFVASARRVAAAAFGASGTEGFPMLSEASAVFAPILRQAAQTMTRPLIFHIQEDDDLFPAPGGRSLFAEFTSTDKELVSAAGTHRAVPPEALVRLCEWLATRLLAEN
jgi:dienelactone hydrolase